jgi:hypothetical protein
VRPKTPIGSENTFLNWTKANIIDVDGFGTRSCAGTQNGYRGFWFIDRTARLVDANRGPVGAQLQPDDEVSASNSLRMESGRAERGRQSMDAQELAEHALQGVIAGITRWLLDKVGTRDKKSEMTLEKGAVPAQKENSPSRG